MVKGVIYGVYVLPVIFSLIFGSIVLAGILQQPGRELNLMQTGSFNENSKNDLIEIFGLKAQYSTSEKIQIQISINDSSFSCGDLYITIYPTGNEKAISQSGFFDQCYNSKNPFLPIDDNFSETVNTPGNYDIVVDMIDKNQENSITTREKFTVK
jgi:hypothetical protein